MGGFDKEETSFQTSSGKGIVGNPAEYRVMQGVVFTKKGSDPTIQEIAKKKQEEGTILKTTGKRWTSDTGNEWVQLDNDDQPGWSLVRKWRWCARTDSTEDPTWGRATLDIA